MEWFVLAALGGIISTWVTWTMEAIRDRWRKGRGAPMTMDQVRRSHRWRAIFAAAFATYLLLLGLYTLAVAHVTPWYYALASSELIAAWLYARSARRRWQRYRDSMREK